MKENEADAAMKPLVGPLGESLKHMQTATMWFVQNAMKRPDNAGAGSYDFMHLFGLVALGYMWAQMAKAALAKKNGNGSAPQLDAKLMTAKFFVERMLPETAAHLKRIQSGADNLMDMPAEAF